MRVASIEVLEDLRSSSSVTEIQQFGQNTASDIYLLKWAASFGMSHHHRHCIEVHTINYGIIRY